MAKLEQLVQMVGPIVGNIPTTHLSLGSSRQHSSLDVLGSAQRSMTRDHTGSGSPSEDEAEAQPKLSPLPMRAYSKRPDVDPLSPPEEATYSDDEFVTVAETGLSKILILTEKSHENTRFYGKSSVIVLTNQLVNEKFRGTDTCSMRNRRNQFWDVPDVSLTVSRAYFVTEEHSSGCPLYSSPPLCSLSSLMLASCDTSSNVTSIISTYCFRFSTALPSCAR